jgi:hypothetical protein
MISLVCDMAQWHLESLDCGQFKGLIALDGQDK